MIMIMIMITYSVVVANLEDSSVVAIYSLHFEEEPYEPSVAIWPFQVEPGAVLVDPSFRAERRRLVDPLFRVERRRRRQGLVDSLRQGLGKKWQEGAQGLGKKPREGARGLGKMSEDFPTYPERALPYQDYIQIRELRPEEPPNSPFAERGSLAPTQVLSVATAHSLASLQFHSHK